jgi:maltoporin
MRSGLTDERRVITAISFNQKWQISKSNMLHFLGQYYILPEFKDIPTSTDLPKDEGQVFGIRHLYKKSDDNFNDFSVRTGAGLANGGDNGLAIPWITYGTKALDGTYKTAESLSIVEHFLFDLKKNKSALNGYAIYNINKGATSVYSDSKNDFTVGTRFGYFLTDHFHLIMDNTYQVRRSSDLKDGEVFRLGIIPTISLNGERNLMAKNVIRFIFGYAKYNNEAVKNYLSRSTSITGNYDYFIGIKTEWDF